ncbi:PREDICTED: gibberellin 20 oxidase 2-like [Tarenaya hassleriana]|uniref:gibberellin 20 oxidase 2-like n=1 Tax=Tarenaya hassleriana TaxID=28532 RepID=UPI00053C16BC|nr:PREDICTED: gibberellin 20 oxidase 2-like [Tarenaya hassleriana]
MSSSTILLNPNLLQKGDENSDSIIFDTSSLQKQKDLPAEFVWPEDELSRTKQPELNEPFIDLSCLENGDEEAIAKAASLVRAACLSHGFFQVTNHGIDSDLIKAAYEEIDAVFKLPLEKKLSLRRKSAAEVSGYSGAHADRFSSKLPWKETFSFGYGFLQGEDGSKNMVLDYFKSALGSEFEHVGSVYEKYCEAMKEMSLTIMELLGRSMGIDRSSLRDFFKDGSSIMRCNYYPPCNKSTLTLGTGPHTDPTSLTILHQDQVGGLEVFLDGQWKSVRPHPDAFVINIGDTFMALSNGTYKSCLHRAVVNREKERRSLVFFVCPEKTKVVRPPENLLIGRGRDGGALERAYPDFTWSDLFDFTQLHYRPDSSTLPNFFHWLNSS